MKDQEIENKEYEPLSILSIEDDMKWRDIIQGSISKQPGISIKFVKNYRRAIDIVKFQKFDVFSLDSGIQGAKRIPQLIDKTEEFWGYSVPIIVLTGYTMSVSEEERKKIFGLIDKADCLSQPGLLRQKFSKAISDSLYKQAELLLSSETPQDPRVVTNLLSKLLTYQKWLSQEEDVDPLSEDFLELYGFVLEVREDEFDVVLYHEKGEKEYRTFPADRFKDASFSQDDCFRYTIVRKGTRVISNIEKAESTLSDDELDELRNFDMSKFDKFQYNPEESDEQDKGE
jgi:CheY-like chemotaxis protein